MAEKPFNILGLCNGSQNGNSEILLKAALKSIESSSERPTKISWVHVPSVEIPRNPRPLKNSADISLGHVQSMKAGVLASDAPADDRRAILDAILDADALIFATPVYSHQPPGFLKAVTDRIMGPFTDAAFVQRVLERKEAGDPKFKDQVADARVLKPRVVGFLVVAGSHYSEHYTMALPTLHQFVYPIHAKVVDQIIFSGYASPGSVIFKDGGSCVERARLLGKNVASQLGKKWDDATFLGPNAEGSCPYCHLAQFEFVGGVSNEICCTVCGMRGTLVAEGNTIKPVWSSDASQSCITMEGKFLHADHIQVAGKEEADARQAFTAQKLEAVKADLLGVDIPPLPMPSIARSQGKSKTPSFCTVM